MACGCGRSNSIKGFNRTLRGPRTVQSQGTRPNQVQAQSVQMQSIKKKSPSSNMVSAQSVPVKPIVPMTKERQQIERKRKAEITKRILGK